MCRVIHLRRCCTGCGNTGNGVSNADKKGEEQQPLPSTITNPTDTDNTTSNSPNQDDPSSWVVYKKIDCNGKDEGCTGMLGIEEGEGPGVKGIISPQSYTTTIGDAASGEQKEKNNKQVEEDVELKQKIEGKSILTSHPKGGQSNNDEEEEEGGKTGGKSDVLLLLPQHQQHKQQQQQQGKGRKLTHVFRQPHPYATYRCEECVSRGRCFRGGSGVDSSRVLEW